MNVFILILCILLWLLSIWCLYWRQVAAPALSLGALCLLSLIRENGMQLIPINTTIIITWVSMTLIVTFATIMQPDAIRRQTRGMLYIIGGGIVGLVLGLLGFSVTSALSMRYAWMVVAVVAAIFLGFLFYTNTPDGRTVKPGSGNFLRYLLAKGFPTAITLMQLGIALVLTLAVKNVNGL